MAERLGAKAYHLPVPAVVSSLEVKKVLLEDRNVRSCIEIARAASLGLISVGKVSHDATAVTAGFLDPSIIDELKDRGAVGEILCRFFDIQGRQANNDVDNRVIGLTLDDMRRIHPVIAVSGGVDRAGALLGALRTGCIDILIIDEESARAVLNLDAAVPRTSS